MDNFEHITTKIYENYITPLDRCTIATRFKIHAEAITSTEEFIEAHEASILESGVYTNRKGEEKRTGAKLELIPYKGAVAFCSREGNSWFITKIQFNARNIHHCHNAKPVTANQFMSALTVMRDALMPLLCEPSDWIHIIPGAQKNSKAYWSLLEITSDFYDPDGSLEEVFGNAYRAYTSEGYRHKNGTLQIGATDGPMKMKFYRKDKQMAKMLRKMNNLNNVPRVFRLELVLSQNKLTEILGHDHNMEKIDGKNRLVRFNPEHLALCHQKNFSELKGCFKPPSAANKPENKMGRFMALISAYFKIPLTDLLGIYNNCIDCDKRTLTRFRNSALSTLETISPVSFDDIFSYNNYQNPAFIEVDGRYKRGIGTHYDNDVWCAYGCNYEQLPVFGPMATSC